MGVDPGLSQDVAWYASQGGEPGPEGYLALNLDSIQALPTSPKLTHHFPIWTALKVAHLLHQDHQGEILSYDLSGKPRAEPHRIRAAKAKARVNKFAAEVDVSYIEVTRETQKVGYLDVI